MPKLLSLVFFSHFVLALTPQQQSALDNLVNERRVAVPHRSRINQLVAKINDFEKRLTPVVFNFTRMEPVLDEQFKHLDALAVFLKQPRDVAYGNPYLDKDWLVKTRRDVLNVCCAIRQNPRVAKEVQENLSNGLPPLPDGAYSTISERTHGAIPASDLPTLPASPRSLLKKSSTGFSNKMISGLQEVSTPDPTPAPAAPPTPAESSPAPVTPPAPATQPLSPPSTESTPALSP